MKINEVIVEAGIGQAIGRGVGKVAGGVGQAAGGVGQAAGIAAGAAGAAQQGYKAGKAKMDKILSPSKWFSSDDKDQSDDKKTSAPATHETRDVLQRVAQGRPLFRNDLIELKRLSQKVDNPNLAKALKLASTNQPLDKTQQQLVLQHSQEY
jgi:hypothetical protein